MAQPKLAAVLAEMDPAVLTCRDFRHSWAPFDAYAIPGGFDQRVQCKRCGTLRHRTLTRRGHVMTTAYVYPDGYLVKGLGRLDGEDRDRIRLAALMPTLREA